MSTVSSINTLNTSVTANATSSTSTSSTSSSDEIDWDGLIEEAVAAKLAKADSVDLKITKKEAEIAAYGEMQSLLGDLVTAANALRAPSGTLASSEDVFRTRAGYLSANGDVDAENSLGITVEKGTQVGSYDIEILQIAKAHKVVGSEVASSTTDLGYSGVMSLGTVEGASIEVAIDSGMTLNEIAEAINGQSGASGVQASVLKVSENSYRLVLSGAETGQTIAASAVSGNDVLAALGVLDDEGSFAQEVQAAQVAIFSIDGVEITRDGNDIDDVIEGVTFNLYQETPEDTSIAVSIEADLSSIKTAIQALVDAYNAYRTFALGQQTLAVSDDTTQSDEIGQSVLFGDGTFRGINTAILDALNVSVDGRSLADLGMSFDESNYLELDEDTLDAALLSDVEAIAELLSFQMTTSSTDLMLLSRGSSVPGAFTIDVTIDESGVVTGASVGGNASLFTVSGTSLIGAAGTVYEGYTLVYVGDQSASIDVSFSTGLAEVLHNAAEIAANDGDGTLQTVIGGLEDDVDSLQERSDEITARADDYRARLTERYAAIQAAIAQAEAVQDYLEAMLDAMYG